MTTTWRDDITHVLKELGGTATLEDIYRAMPRRRRKASNWKATVRNTLQVYDPRSNAYAGTNAAFSRRGRGKWALRPARKPRQKKAVEVAMPVMAPEVVDVQQPQP